MSALPRWQLRVISWRDELLVLSFGDNLSRGEHVTQCLRGKHHVLDRGWWYWLERRL